MRQPTEGAMLDRVEAWHNGAGEGKSLHEYLGMTWEEYARWDEGRGISRKRGSMSSQQHRDKAMSLIAGLDHRCTAEAQVHATLALYEGLYELLGDGSAISDAARRSGG